MIVTDDAALERVLGMPPQDFAEAAARLAEAPRDRSLGPWRQDGTGWVRDTAALRKPAAEVRFAAGAWRIDVCRPDGRELPVVEARMAAAAAREVADVLLAGLGWEIRA